MYSKCAGNNSELAREYRLRGTFDIYSVSPGLELTICSDRFDLVTNNIYTKSTHETVYAISIHLHVNDASHLMCAGW